MHAAALECLADWQSGAAAVREEEAAAWTQLLCSTCGQLGALTVRLQTRNHEAAAESAAMHNRLVAEAAGLHITLGKVTSTAVRRSLEAACAAQGCSVREEEAAVRAALLSRFVRAMTLPAPQPTARARRRAEYRKRRRAAERERGVKEAIETAAVRAVAHKLVAESAAADRQRFVEGWASETEKVKNEEDSAWAILVDISRRPPRAPQPTGRARRRALYQQRRRAMQKLRRTGAAALEAALGPDPGGLCHPAPCEGPRSGAAPLLLSEFDTQAKWENGAELQRLRAEVEDQQLTIDTCRASLKALRAELNVYKKTMNDAIQPLYRTAEVIRQLKERCSTAAMRAHLGEEREERLVQWLGEVQEDSQAEVRHLACAKQLLWNALAEEVPWAPSTGFATGRLGDITVGQKKPWLTHVQEEGRLPDQRHGLLTLASTGVGTVVSGSQRPGAGPNVGHPLGGVRGSGWSGPHAEQFVTLLARLGYGAVVTVDQYAADAIRHCVAAQGMVAPTAPSLEDFATPPLADFIAIMGITHALALDGAPINIHCAGGTGRTGLLFMGLGVLERWWSSPAAFAAAPIGCAQDAVHAVIGSYSPNAGEFNVAACGAGNKQLLVDFACMAAEESDVSLNNCPPHRHLMELLSRMLRQEVQRSGETPAVFPVAAALRVCAADGIDAACDCATAELKRVTGAIFCTLVFIDSGQLATPQSGTAPREWKRRSVSADCTIVGEAARRGLTLNAPGAGMCYGAACVPIGGAALAHLVNEGHQEFDADCIAAAEAFASVAAPTLRLLYATAL